VVRKCAEESMHAVRGELVVAMAHCDKPFSTSTIPTTAASPRTTTTVPTSSMSTRNTRHLWGAMGGLEVIGIWDSGWVAL